MLIGLGSALSCLVVISAVSATLSVIETATTISKTISISYNNPLVYYHGRWDTAPSTWWASSGFKLNLVNLKSLSLTLGQNTSSPAAVAVSIDYGPFFTVNVTQGVNAIPLQAAKTYQPGSTVVRINVEGWQNNRVELRSIQINQGAFLIPYKAQKRAFQFIGDSLSAGQFLPLGVNQAWPFLVAEHFKAEHRINAQPGATLTDRESYGNVHGVSYQYFRTEDTQFYYNPAHNYTTQWNFGREKPASTHFVIHIGANDASQGVSEANFTETYLAFLARLRTTSSARTAPIFVLTPFGWPNAEGTPNYYYYPNAYADIVSARQKLGDRNVFLVNTTGWLEWADVFPDNQHPNVPGMAKIAGLFEKWLENWGLHPDRWMN